uniref:Ig-like domain-containing protein n=1 Tax=Myripristis murdjan TaxID=586833 RepID=A0A667WSX5_9TELE
YIFVLSCFCYKKVGDTVELPSCLPSEGVDFAAWEYGDTRIASTDMVETSDGDQFQGRVKINGQNFSLTVESLTLNDSGSFKFVSEVNGEQRITTIITLKSVTEKPVLKVSSTWHELNSSCTVLLECGSARHSEVTYSWTVGNHTFKGSRVHFTVIPPGGDTDVTCTVSNSVSVNNASQIVHCSNICHKAIFQVPFSFQEVLSVQMFFQSPTTGFAQGLKAAFTW